MDATVKSDQTLCDGGNKERMSAEMELMELTKTEAWWLAARDRVKEVIDGPDLDIDRIIRSVLENDGKVPVALAGDYSALGDLQVAVGVENAIASKSTQRLPRAW